MAACCSRPINCSRDSRSRTRSCAARAAIRASIGGRQGLTTTLSNVSEVTGQSEAVNVSTVQLRDGSVFFLIGVAPAQQARTYLNTFNRIRQNVQLAAIGRTRGATDDAVSPNRKYEGMRVAEAAKQAGKDPFDFVFDLLIEERGSLAAAQELARRRAEWVMPPLRVPRGVLAKYARCVRSASEGAITS